MIGAERTNAANGTAAIAGAAAVLVMIGILAMRYVVVIGGQNVPLS